MTYALRPAEPRVIKSRPRHVVLIVMESLSSWPMDVDDLSFGERLAPNLRRLRREGISFEPYLPLTGATLHELMGMLFSNPGCADSRFLIDRRDAIEHYPTRLPAMMEQEGFEPTFYYGGSYDWLDLKLFLSLAGFRQLKGGLDVAAIDGGTIARADEEVYRMALRDRQNAQGSTFSLILTASNHPPYELPASYQRPSIYVPHPQRTRLRDPVLAKRRLQAYAYADKALGDYLEAMRTLPEFEQTLFVVTGDHAMSGLLHTSADRALHDGRVPIIFYAPDLLGSYSSSSKRIASHLDLLPSLMSLIISQPRTIESWGRSLFDEDAHADSLSNAALCSDGRCLVCGAYYHQTDSGYDATELSVDEMNRLSFLKREFIQAGQRRLFRAIGR